MFNFLPLSEKNISEAIALVNSVFLEDAKSEHNAASAYRASLEPEKYKNYYIREDHTITLLEYFVVEDVISKKIVGVTGLYARSKDPKSTVWLGWYCVDPLERGKGYGEAILKWTMAKAKERGFTHMKLWTTTDSNEVVAQKLYEKLDFKITEEEAPSDKPYKILYRERVL